MLVLSVSCTPFGNSGVAFDHAFFVNHNQQLRRCLLASVASVCVRSIQKLNMGIVFVSNHFVCSLSMAKLVANWDS
jgi:hypothetical protein